MTTWLRRRRRASLVVAAAFALIVGDVAPASADEVVPDATDRREELLRVQGLIEDGRYEQAEADARSLLRETKRSLGLRSVATADALDVLVTALSRRGKFRDPETAELAERAVEIRRDLQGATAPSLAGSLYGLALVRYGNGRFEDARSNVESSLEIRRRVLGPDHPDVAESLQLLGVLQLELDDRDRARESLERSLEIRERSLGSSHPDVAEALSALGGFQSRGGEYEAARACFERALEIRERALRPGHPKVVSAMSNLAGTQQILGNYRAARELYERALDLQKQAAGTERVALLSSLASLLHTTGDYTQAKAYYEQALTLEGESRGHESSAFAHTAYNLAELLRETGDLEQSKALHERALEIRQRIWGPEHQTTAESLAALAYVLYLQGDVAGSRTYFETALAIQDRPDEPNRLGLADTLTGLAETLKALGDVDGAVRSCRRALAIRERVYGPQHLTLVWPLTTLGKLLRGAGNLEEALATFERALAIATGISKELPQRADLLAEEAPILAALGRSRDAFALALQAATLARGHVVSTARYLPERQALLYAASVRNDVDVALSLLRPEVKLGPTATEEAWDAVIRARALVLDEMAERHRSVSDAADTKVSIAAAELRSERQRLANLLVRGASGLPAGDYAKVLAEARMDCERAEESLARRRGVADRRTDPGLADVAVALPRASALFAYSLFDRAELHGTDEAPDASGGALTPCYGAFVLRPGKKPEWMSLGNAGRIDALVEAWRKEASDVSPSEDAREAEARYRRAASELREAIWDPLSARLSGVETVLLVPDGSLNLVSWAAFPVGATDYLVEAAPTIHLLSAERDLVPAQGKGRAGRGLLALGGADFDDASRFAALAKVSEPSPKALYHASADPCPDFHELRFPPLPASAREAVEVAHLWKESGGARRSAGRATEERSAIVLLGREANETTLKRVAGSRTVVHLATHGFFLGGPCHPTSGTRRSIGGLGFAGPGVDNRRSEENPLVLSGLALAGANHRDNAGADEDDGILTAEEIAALDLSGVEWAVLSACDTGVGEIRAGEGVFGLRRAFRIAGARTVIMSLWSVDDEAARSWMKSLYEGRLRRGLGTAEAVRQASRATLDARRDAGESAHPYYWAGFVAAGDWK